MQNRGINNLYDAEPGNQLLGMSWHVDRYPLLRLTMLFLTLTIPLTIILWRVRALQLEMASGYASEFNRLVERNESIPCLDGSILSSDGQIIAQDVVTSNVEVHYRWIEEPPNPFWLKSKVLSRLTRAERRQPERVSQETQRFLEERTMLWDQLQQATGVDPQVLLTKRYEIQTRLNRMRDHVERQRERFLESTSQFPPLNRTGIESLMIWLGSVLATEESVAIPEPIVLQEELAYYVVIDNISPRVRAELQAHSERYPALRVIDATRREYSSGGFAPHIVGYRKPMTQEEWTSRRKLFPEGDPLGYQPGDRIGQMGIEKFHERHLRGVRGTKRLWLNSQGEVVREQIVSEPRPGRDVELTLNSTLQQQTEAILADLIPAQSPSVIQANPRAALQAESLPTADDTAAPVIPRSGCVVVMDVHSGELLAAVSWPSFDINLYLNGDARSRQNLESDPRSPLFPRVHRMALPPGSVFKVVTAVAMLHSGISGDEPFACQGYLKTPNRHRCLPFVHQGVGHGDVDLTLALAQSCNVYFFQGARRIGGATLIDWAQRCGFGQLTGIDLPGESLGTLPSAPCDHLGVAIGQASLTVTPIQVARMLSAVANGGELPTPRVTRATGSTLLDQASPASGRYYQNRVSPPKSIPEVSKHLLDKIGTGLEKVVSHPRGTGYKTVRMANVSIAGKTGTAESRGGPDHAWFAGYVPAEEPRYSLVVVLERGGSGGKAAGPIARKVVQAMLDCGLIGATRQVTHLSEN